MHEVTYDTPRSPTAVQLAKVLEQAEKAGHTEVEVMRGEAGVIFARRSNGWTVDTYPGGGHTISNPTRACEIANIRSKLQAPATKSPSPRPW